MRRLRRDTHRRRCWQQHWGPERRQHVQGVLVLVGQNPAAEGGSRQRNCSRCRNAAVIRPRTKLVVLSSRTSESGGRNSWVASVSNLTISAVAIKRSASNRNCQEFHDLR